MSKKCFQLTVLALLVAGILNMAPKALAQTIHWPTVNKSLRCDYTMVNGDTGSFGTIFDRAWDIHDFPDGNKLGRGAYDAFHLPDPNNIFSWDVKSVLAYKPREIPQPTAGTVFEFTMPLRNAQCKHYKVVKIRHGWVCREVHVARDCHGDGLENLLVQTCTGLRPISDCPPLS